MSSPNEFKSKLIRGGLFVTTRQLLASAFSLVNTLIVARILGPELYGIVATSVGIFYFLKWTGRAGMHIYIVRQPGLQRSQVEQILAFYNTVGVVICTLIWLACPLFAGWTNIPEVSSALRILVPAIWFDMVAGLSISLMERDLRFAESSLIDAVAQVINYCISIPLVVWGWGYWGPVVGTLLQYLSLAIIAYCRSPIRWSFVWQWSELKPVIGYGLSYYASNWIFSFKSLTLPLIVTPLAGAGTAGILAITLRIVKQITLLRQIVKRMSISVMAKIIDDAAKTRRAVNKAMLYQGLIMGSICAVFSCFAVWLIPTVFGEKWIASSQIFPFIALSEMTAAMFDLHNSTLYAAGYNRKVAIRNLGYVGSLWLGTAVFIPLFGILGYGLAEILALPSYYLIHKAFKDIYGSPEYRNAFWVAFAALPSLFGSLFLEPIMSLVVFLVSYSLLFTLNKKIRYLSYELFLSLKLKIKPDKTKSV